MYPACELQKIINQAPDVPAIYALYDIDGRAAYVGETANLRDRLERHLIRRSSSPVANPCAAMLNIDYISRVEWWAGGNTYDFHDGITRKAAEIVAFDVINPYLRSKSSLDTKALEKYSERLFRQDITKLLRVKPSTPLYIPQLHDAFIEINSLKNRINELEKKIELMIQTQTK